MILKETYTICEKIYTVYAERDDITFIMQDTIQADEVAETTVIGWHYGEPGEHSKKYIGKLTAEF